MQRKTDTFHTPSERKNKHGQTAYMYRVVRINPRGKKPTTASFDWMESLHLMRRAGWSPGKFRQCVRDVLYDLEEVGKIDWTCQLSPQLWKELQRIVLTA